MIRTTEDKLAIVISDSDPVDDLQGLQREIIEVIQAYDYNNFGSGNGCPFYHLLNLLASTLPTYNQQNQLLEFTGLVDDPQISQAKIIAWFNRHKESVNAEPVNI